MIAHPRPLIEVFAALPDFRKSRGKRHPLSAIFALACCAMLCGARSYSAIAEWGRNYGAQIAQALGFTHATPCAATLHMIFRQVHRDEFEAYLGAWANSVVGSLPTAPETPAVAVALDGKTLRGSKKQGAPGMHLLSALAHHVGVTLAQHAVDDKTNEITAVEPLLQPLGPGRSYSHDGRAPDSTPHRADDCRKGRGLCHDRQREPAAAAGRYRAGLYAPALGDRKRRPGPSTWAMGASNSAISRPVQALAGFMRWPGLAQVFQLGRHVMSKKRARNGWKWSMGPPVWPLSEPRPRALARLGAGAVAD